MAILPSGVHINLADNFTDSDGHYFIGFDVNWPTGPNVPGEDQWTFSYCVTQACLDSATNDRNQIGLLYSTDAYNSTQQDENLVALFQ